MLGVADGLSYLHYNDVVHGDIKGVCLDDPGGEHLLKHRPLAKHSV